MNGYVEAGYVVVLGTLATYGSTLLARERAARARTRGRTMPPPAGSPSPQSSPSPAAPDAVSSGPGTSK